MAKSEKPTSGYAIASFVLGIFAVPFGWIPFFGWLLILLSGIFGIVALNHIKQGKSAGKGLAVSGLVMAVLGLALTVILLSSMFVSFIGAMSCNDMPCFVQKANQCTTASYTEKSSFGTITYSSRIEAGVCILTKRVVALNENEDAVIKALVEGKSMDCSYEKGKFNGQWTSSLVEGLEYCEGDLKEAIGTLILLV